MAGHSKWANIKHRKERMDNKRGQVFSRIVKEIYVAAKLSGTEPSSNPRLRLALQKAKDANLPKDNIDKALKRGSGQLEGAVYEQIRYEGYGPNGVAVIIDCVTDNRNRTTADIRYAFNKNNGSLGTDGSVVFLFDRVGQFLYSPSDNPDAIINSAIEAGVDDFSVEADGSVEILSSADKFLEVMQKLKDAYPPDAADLIMRAQNPVLITDKQVIPIRKLLDALEDCEDTQEVYTNAQFPS